MSRSDYLVLLGYVGCLAVLSLIQGHQIDKLAEDLTALKMRTEWLELVSRETEKS